MADESLIRRSFLFLGIGLTLLGCFIAALAIALPAWQVVELAEFNAIHEHGIFYDCIRSETYPLERLRQAGTAGHHQRRIDTKDQIASRAHKRDLAQEDSSSSEHNPAILAVSSFSTKNCIHKTDSASSSTWTMRMAIEEGDPAAKEMLFHRFMPQHKAVIFFFIFSVIFSLISIVVGSCSSCFVPNGILHVISVGMAMSCSILSDVIFFLASMKVEDRNIYGLVHVYYQHLSYAFCVHIFGSATLCAATLCSGIAAYLLVRKECQQYGYCYSSQRRKKWRKEVQYFPYLSNISEPNLPSKPHTINLKKQSTHQEVREVCDCSLYNSHLPSMSFYGTQTMVANGTLDGVVDARLLNLSPHHHHHNKLDQYESQPTEPLPLPPPAISHISNRNETMHRPLTSTLQPVQMRLSSPYTTRAALAAEGSPIYSGTARRRPSAASALSAPGYFDSKDSATNHMLMATFLKNSEDFLSASQDKLYNSNCTSPPIVRLNDV